MNDELKKIIETSDADPRLKDRLLHTFASPDGPAGQGMRMTGILTSTLVRPDGSTLTQVAANLITDVGFDFIANAIGLAAQPSEMTHISVGTGVTAAAVGDTTMETELLRKAATFAHTVGTKVFEFESTFAAGEATGAITEAGVLNAPTGGILLDRVVFSVINKGADDTLTQKFTFTLS